MRTESFRGFSLVEVLVSLSILAVGIIGVLGAFSLCVTRGSAAIRIDKAAAMAESEITLVVACGSAANLPGEGESGTHRWRRTTTTVSGGLSRVTVVVSWPEQGQERTLELAQIFGDR